MLQAHRNSDVTFLKAPILEKISGVVHGFSTRRESISYVAIEKSGSQPDGEREVFLAALGMAAWPMGRLRQVHSNRVRHFDTSAFANESPEGDAAYTGLPGIALEVRTADCVPILIAERSARVVAMAHAGWRGTSGGVVRKVVNSIVSEFGVSAADLAVVMGPHIGVCCMEVGEEVFAGFDDPGVFERPPEWAKPHLNLAEANRRQLLAAGVRPQMIQTSLLCTRCRSDMFYSYRRDGADAGRMYAVIGIQP